MNTCNPDFDGTDLEKKCLCMISIEHVSEGTDAQDIFLRTGSRGADAIAERIRREIPFVALAAILGPCPSCKGKYIFRVEPTVTTMPVEMSQGERKKLFAQAVTEIRKAVHGTHVIAVQLIEVDTAVGPCKAVAVAAEDLLHPAHVVVSRIKPDKSLCEPETLPQTIGLIGPLWGGFFVETLPMTTGKGALN